MKMNTHTHAHTGHHRGPCSAHFSALTPDRVAECDLYAGAINSYLGNVVFRRAAEVIYLRRTQQYSAWKCCHASTKLRQRTEYYCNLSPRRSTGQHLKYSIDSDAISAAKVRLWFFCFVLFCFRRKEKIVCLNIKEKKMAGTWQIARTLLKCGAISAMLFWCISPAAVKVTTPSALRADVLAHIKMIWTFGNIFTKNEKLFPYGSNKAG